MDRGILAHSLDFWPFPYARAPVDRSLVFFGRDLPRRILATISGERYRHGSRIATGVERHDRIDICPGCIYVLHGISSCQHEITRTLRPRRTVSRLLPSRRPDPESPLPSLPFPATATVHP